MPDPISWSHSGPFLAAALLVGYLLGSLPFGLILTRLAGLGDLRRIGSGNIGTTNVLRTGRKDLAAATLLLDGGKGAAAVLLAGIWGPDTALMAGLGAMLGHLYPVWLKFKGGKGVATALGILLAIAWPVGIAACATWLAVAAAFRFSSLSALAVARGQPLLRLVAHRRPAGHRARRHSGRLHLGAPSRQHSAAAQGRRAQDRAKDSGLP